MRVERRRGRGAPANLLSSLVPD